MVKSKSQSMQAKQPVAQRGWKGGYLSDKNINFNKSQTIEELTGGRLKKKK